MDFGSMLFRVLGTVNNCRDKAFRAALSGLGLVGFTGNRSITLNGTVNIASNTTILTSGNAVTLAGDNTNRMFTVSSGVVFTMTGLTLTGGRNNNGGAIYISTNATVQLTNCNLTANSANGLPETIGNNGESNSEVGGNGGAGGDGAGGSFYSAGNAILVNSTLSHGSATGGTNGPAGSGVFDAGHNGLPGQAYGGNIARGSGTFTLTNTILSTNLSGGCGYGIVVDGGNIICADGSLALGGSSFTNTDPRLGPFRYNGGITKTMYPLAGSLAIDSGSEIPELSYDQRGFLRPSGSHTDIGSVEAMLPALTSGNASSTTFSFTYPTLVGLTYVVQFKTNLNDTASTLLSTNVGSGSVANYSTVKSSTGSRFFRLLVQ